MKRYNISENINSTTILQYYYSLRILTFFAHIVYKDLNIEEIMVFMGHNISIQTIKMVGPAEQNYYTPSIEIV